MDLTDKGAVEAAVAYDALLSFVVKLDMLTDVALDWLDFKITNEIHADMNPPPDSKIDFWLAARALVRRAREL